MDASVRIDAEDRTGIERLVRYCARPPFALQRLHAYDATAALASPEARLLYRLPRPDLEGRTELLLSPLELLERLAPFVPPPRVHRHRYHGVLAPNARLRSAVVALGRSESEAASPSASPGEPVPSAAESSHRPRPASPTRVRWAQLLARIYDVLPLLCPECGGQMRVLAFLTDPPVVRAILLHLDLPHQPPRPGASSGRAPPRSEPRRRCD